MARLTKAQALEHAQDRKAAYDRGYLQGEVNGEASAKKELEFNIRISERKANIELVRALAQMTEANARAVVTVIGEGGLHG